MRAKRGRFQIFERNGAGGWRSEPSNQRTWQASEGADAPIVYMLARQRAIGAMSPARRLQTIKWLLQAAPERAFAAPEINPQRNLAGLSARELSPLLRHRSGKVRGGARRWLPLLAGESGAATRPSKLST